MNGGNGPLLVPFRRKIMAFSLRQRFCRSGLTAGAVK